MTSEDDFQKQLDANPDDHLTRLVFADWLQERGDKRAEGYRAMGVLRRVPVGVTMAPIQEDQVLFPFSGKAMWVFGPMSGGRAPPVEDHHMPDVWYSLIKPGPGCDSYWNRFLSRREAEDAAAIAFAKLRKLSRTKLLSQPVVAVSGS